MGSRLETSTVPAKVKALKQSEDERGLSEIYSQLSQRGLELRESYVQEFEALLRLEELQYGGLTLEEKMYRFSVEARENMLHWSKMHSISKKLLRQHGFYDGYTDIYDVFVSLILSL